MEHNIPLITTIAAGLVMALIFGFIAVRLRIPALLGYLLAGIVIGPATPGFVADTHIAAELSEIGVMLLMFGVGLHFSIDDLLSVKKIALPGAIVQMAFATLLGLGAASYWGWSLGSGLVFGLCLACASTVVLLKALEARGVLDSINGRIAVGWLVVEDLATVLVLVLLPAVAGLLGGTGNAVSSGENGLLITIGQTLLQITAFVMLMLIAGRRFLPWLLWQAARTGSRELFTLTVIATAIGIAFGAAKLFSVSFALGAFFAGMVMRESKFSHRAAEESLPLRDAFSVLFFVSVGMLFDPAIVIDEPLKVITVVAIIVVGKSTAALILTIALRYPLNTGLVVAASLAQIGEFSFILAGLGVTLGLLSPDGMSLVLAGALVSIALNPLVFLSIEPLRRTLLNRSKLAQSLERSADPYAELPRSTQERYLQQQVVIVGYGRVGRGIAEALDKNDVPYVVAEQNRELVEKLRAEGKAAVSGDAVDPAVLIQAHIAKAAMLVIAIPDLVGVRQMAETAKTLNPEIEVIVRTHSDEESELLLRDSIGHVFHGDAELAKGISSHILNSVNAKRRGHSA